MRICQVCGARYRGSPTQCPLDGGKLLELPDPLLGRNIGGRYLIVEKIGSGGMGTVYRAREEPSGTDVAIKFLLPDLAIEMANRQRFLREAKAANRIDHENIIEVNDFGETDDGLVYLTMEFLDGIPLSKEIERGPLSLSRALRIAMQCASALARAHELDVVHRDIKPENIYLVAARSAQGQRRPTAGPGVRLDVVKILDFGLAHMKGELRLTASGAVFGTPEYMAPEQARGAPITGLADLYALGCVLFEMCAGTPPFSGSTPDLILKHMRQPAPLLTTRRPEAPLELEALVKRLLEKDPGKRHRDGFHLLEDLRRIADQLPERPSIAPAIATDAAGPRARSDTVSISPEPGGQVLPDTWEQRVQLFRELAGRAYAGAAPPAWLAPAIDEMAERIAEVRRLDGDLLRATEQVAERESTVRQLRLRMGRAIDELGRDESRTLRRIEELEETLKEGRERLADLEPLLGQTLGDLGATIAGRPREGGHVRVDSDLARAVRDAGSLAEGWVDLSEQVRRSTREREERERERDDLRFQISQLKGRLGTLAADHEFEAGAMRERAARLGAAREATIEELQTRAMALIGHFAGFPALADAVRSATLPAPNRDAIR